MEGGVAVPSIKKSQNVDRSRLEPAMPAPVPPMMLPQPQAQSPSPFMMCSMPQQAASLDAVARQFYNRSFVPQTRILKPSGSK